MSTFSSYYLEGSTSLQTSVANAEIISRMLRDFEFVNDQSCHVSINGSDFIYLRAGQGLKLDTLFSLKIQETGITFNWIGEHD